MSSFLKKVEIKAAIKKSQEHRGILLIKAGIPDLWEPTEKELQELAGLFITASDDPQGAVVAVRSGVDVSFIPLPEDKVKVRVKNNK